MSTNAAVWLGIGLLLVQSGTFSGLNLALFGVGALKLRILAGTGNEKARQVLELRQDSNFLLTTILWANVGTNVLLAMLSDSVLTGAVAFVFSTFIITFGGEIIPQAYFSRNALQVASLLSPMLRLYQTLLYPVAKPSALLLDAWLGKETVDYLSEAELKEALEQHVQAPESDVRQVEGVGAINFLSLHDLRVSELGEPVGPANVLRLPQEQGRPVFPTFEASPGDPLLRQVQSSGRRWVVIVPADAAPVLALDAWRFLLAVMFAAEPADPLDYCHRPITVTDDHTRLGDLLADLPFEPTADVIDRDLILLWGEQRRIITGADLLGFLLRGVTHGTGYGRDEPRPSSTVE